MSRFTSDEKTDWEEAVRQARIDYEARGRRLSRPIGRQGIEQLGAMSAQICVCCLILLLALSCIVALLMPYVPTI